MNMSKPTFSLVGLCLLTMAFSGNRASASPAEDSDRQFLSQLENGKAAPAPTATPTPAAPEMRATQPQMTSQEQAPKAPAVVKKTTQKAPKRVAATTGHVQQLPDVADGELPTTATTVTVVRSADADHDRDHDRDHNFFHRLFGHMLNNHPEDW
jgi:hypothetical protein